MRARTGCPPTEGTARHHATRSASPIRDPAAVCSDTRHLPNSEVKVHIRDPPVLSPALIMRSPSCAPSQLASDDNSCAQKKASPIALQRHDSTLPPEGADKDRRPSINQVLLRVHMPLSFDSPSHATRCGMPHFAPSLVCSGCACSRPPRPRIFTMHREGMGAARMESPSTGPLSFLSCVLVQPSCLRVGKGL